jgi:hypothetical protein
MPYRFKDFWGCWCIEGSGTHGHAQNVVDTAVSSTAREMWGRGGLGTMRDVERDGRGAC